MIVKKLTLINLEKSVEIQDWLNHFSNKEKPTAKLLLCRLKFISMDEYSKWLISNLEHYSEFESTAVYAVRKFSKNAKCLWQKNGQTQKRPAQTQGSEDLVSSVISTANRQYNNCFIDHPSLSVLRKQKVRHIILIDDSIGSGKRVADFIKLMTNSKTFMSWWSGAYITIHVLSLARTTQAEELILSRTSGSNHSKRKVRLSSKLRFKSDLVYDRDDFHTRWGNSYKKILALCSSKKKIPINRRKGFGDVLGNIIFYHSVPNNIPGMLFCKRDTWTPLFPNRSLPNWIINVLEGKPQASKCLVPNYEKLLVPESMVSLLRLIKKGLRSTASLSRRLDYDNHITKELISVAVGLGFISTNLRILKAGKDYLIEKQQCNPMGKPDYSLYIPQSWCAAQETVQPSDYRTSEAKVQADSINSELMDGDDGKSSLERTDAIATSSPMRDVPQPPSWARKRHIPDGPKG